MVDRARLLAVVENKRFQGAITVVIIVNAVILGLLTADLPPDAMRVLTALDTACVIVYVVEAVLKIAAYRAGYFRSKWNVFDFSITVLSVIPDALLPFPVQVMRLVRIVRIARIARLVSAFGQLRIIVEAIGKSIPGVAWTSVLLALVVYMFDVLGVSLYGAEYPDFFGDLAVGAFTLFQLVTLEGWADIATEIMAGHPFAWLYFVTFIVISAFIMVNVVLGIILKTIEESTQAERINQADDSHTQLMTELAELKAQIETVEYLLKKQQDANGSKG